MTLIGQLREKIAADQFELSKHAVDQSIVRRISMQELREAVAAGGVIEDYPDDKYGPSCLVFGETAPEGRCTCNAATRAEHWLKIITLYDPKPERWIDFRRRRPR